MAHTDPDAIRVRFAETVITHLSSEQIKRHPVAEAYFRAIVTDLLKTTGKPIYQGISRGLHRYNMLLVYSRLFRSERPVFSQLSDQSRAELTRRFQETHPGEAVPKEMETHLIAEALATLMDHGVDLRFPLDPKSIPRAQRKLYSLLKDLKPILTAVPGWFFGSTNLFDAPLTATEVSNPCDRKLVAVFGPNHSDRSQYAKSLIDEVRGALQTTDSTKTHPLLVTSYANFVLGASGQGYSSLDAGLMAEAFDREIVLASTTAHSVESRINTSRTGDLMAVLGSDLVLAKRFDQKISENINKAGRGQLTSTKVLHENHHYSQVADANPHPKPSRSTPAAIRDAVMRMARATTDTVWSAVETIRAIGELPTVLANLGAGLTHFPGPGTELEFVDSDFSTEDRAKWERYATATLLPLLIGLAVTTAAVGMSPALLCYQTLQFAIAAFTKNPDTSLSKIEFALKLKKWLAAAGFPPLSKTEETYIQGAMSAGRSTDWASLAASALSTVWTAWTLINAVKDFPILATLTVTNGLLAQIATAKAAQIAHTVLSATTSTQVDLVKWMVDKVDQAVTARDPLGVGLSSQVKTCLSAAGAPLLSVLVAGATTAAFGTVHWDEKSQSVWVQKGSSTIQVPISPLTDPRISQPVAWIEAHDSGGGSKWMSAQGEILLTRTFELTPDGGTRLTEVLGTPLFVPSCGYFDRVTTTHTGNTTTVVAQSCNSPISDSKFVVEWTPVTVTTEFVSGVMQKQTIRPGIVGQVENNISVRASASIADPPAMFNALTSALTLGGAGFFLGGPPLAVAGFLFGMASGVSATEIRQTASTPQLNVSSARTPNNANSAAFLPKGGYFNVYSNNIPPSTTQISAQLYNPDGTTNSAPITVSEITNGTRGLPTTTPLDSGMSLVSWVEYPADGSKAKLMASVFDPIAGTATTPTLLTSENRTSTTMGFSTLRTAVNGNTVVITSDFNNGLSFDTLQLQLSVAADGTISAEVPVFVAKDTLTLPYTTAIVLSDNTSVTAVAKSTAEVAIVIQSGTTQTTVTLTLATAVGSLAIVNLNGNPTLVYSESTSDTTTTIRTQAIDKLTGQVVGTPTIIATNVPTGPMIVTAAGGTQTFVVIQYPSTTVNGMNLGVIYLDHTGASKMVTMKNSEGTPFVLTGAFKSDMVSISVRDGKATILFRVLTKLVPVTLDILTGTMSTTKSRSDEEITATENDSKTLSATQSSSFTPSDFTRTLTDRENNWTTSKTEAISKSALRSASATNALTNSITRDHSMSLSDSEFNSITQSMDATLSTTKTVIQSGPLSPSVSARVSQTLSLARATVDTMSQSGSMTPSREKSLSRMRLLLASATESYSASMSATAERIISRSHSIVKKVHTRTMTESLETTASVTLAISRSHTEKKTWTASNSAAVSDSAFRTASEIKSFIQSFSDDPLMSLSDSEFKSFTRSMTATLSTIEELSRSDTLTLSIQAKITATRKLLDTGTQSLSIDRSVSDTRSDESITRSIEHTVSEALMATQSGTLSDEATKSISESMDRITLALTATVQNTLSAQQSLVASGTLSPSQTAIAHQTMTHSLSALQTLSELYSTSDQESASKSLDSLSRTISEAKSFIQSLTTSLTKSIEKSTSKTVTHSTLLQSTTAIHDLTESISRHSGTASKSDIDSLTQLIHRTITAIETHSLTPEQIATATQTLSLSRQALHHLTHTLSLIPSSTETESEKASRSRILNQITQTHLTLDTATRTLSQIASRSIEAEATLTSKASATATRENNWTTSKTKAISKSALRSASATNALTNSITRDHSMFLSDSEFNSITQSVSATLSTIKDITESESMSPSVSERVSQTLSLARATVDTMSHSGSMTPSREKSLSQTRLLLASATTSYSASMSATVERIISRSHSIVKKVHTRTMTESLETTASVTLAISRSHTDKKTWTASNSAAVSDSAFRTASEIKSFIQSFSDDPSMSLSDSEFNSLARSMTATLSTIKELSRSDTLTLSIQAKITATRKLLDTGTQSLSIDRSVSDTRSDESITRSIEHTVSEALMATQSGTLSDEATKSISESMDRIMTATQKPLVTLSLSPTHRNRLLATITQSLSITATLAASLSVTPPEVSRSLVPPLIRTLTQSTTLFRNELSKTPTPSITTDLLALTDYTCKLLTVAHPNPEQVQWVGQVQKILASVGITIELIQSGKITQRMMLALGQKTAEIKTLCDSIPTPEPLMPAPPTIGPGGSVNVGMIIGIVAALMVGATIFRSCYDSSKRNRLRTAANRLRTAANPLRTNSPFEDHTTPTQRQNPIDLVFGNPPPIPRKEPRGQRKPHTGD